MKITVTGMQGEGKTTVLNIIKDALENNGYRITSNLPKKSLQEEGIEFIKLEPVVTIKPELADDADTAPEPDVPMKQIMKQTLDQHPAPKPKHKATVSASTKKNS